MGVLEDKRLQILMSALQEGVIILDEKKKIQIFNLVAQKVFDCSFDEVVNKSIDKLIPDSENHEAQFEVIIQKKNKTLVPIAISVHSECIDGQQLYIYSIRDLTYSREAVSDGYWDWFLKEGYEYMSPRFWEMFGYSSSEKEGCPNKQQKRILKKDLELALENIGDYILTKGHCPILTKGQCPFPQETCDSYKNRLKTHTICKNLENNIQEQQEQEAGTHTDVTFLKEAQDALFNIGKILESSLNEIYIFEAETLNFLFVNRGARENIGYSMEELKELTPIDVKTDFNKESFVEMLKSIQKKHKKKHVFETIHKRKNGSYYNVEVHLQKAKYLGKSVFLAVVLDITRHKHFEREREKLIRDLEHSNKELEDFAYVASHDLKSPLVACRGFISYLREDLERKNFEKALDSISEIEGATAEMFMFIEDLLEYSRISRQEENAVEVDVLAIVNDLLDKRASTIEELGVKVVVIEPLPRVYASKVCIKQVFQNLIDNALKYGCSHTEPQVVIGAEKKAGTICYFVKDNGPGISEQYHERIFRLFERLHGGTSGSGAGLAIVKKVIVPYFGRSWVESIPGNGAKFFISFPHMTVMNKPKKNLG